METFSSAMSMQVPGEWEQIDLPGARGTRLVVGAVDTGKSTLARYLFKRLQMDGQAKPAFLDGDPGQSLLGPPTTLTLSLELPPMGVFPAPSRCWRSFIGAVSPSGHMLPMLVSAERLIRTAASFGVTDIIYDSSGLIAPDQGGLALKSALIDLLQPVQIIALQYGRELEPLLQPYRRLNWLQITRLHPVPVLRRRDSNQRRKHRQAQFARYFAEAERMLFDWRGLAIFPAPRFSPGCLVALEDEHAFVLGLGIVSAIWPDRHQVELSGPAVAARQVAAIRLADVRLDPDNFAEI